MTSHGDIQAIFEMLPPDSAEHGMTVDGDLAHHLIRGRYMRPYTSQNLQSSQMQTQALLQSGERRQQQQKQKMSGDTASDGTRKSKYRPASHRYSMSLPGLAREPRGILSESVGIQGIGSRLEARGVDGED